MTVPRCTPAARPRPTQCPSWRPALVAMLVLFASSSAQAQQTQSDKLLHASASAAIVDVVWLATALLEQPLPVRLGASVAVAAVAGLGKEAYDLAGYGTPDVADLAFDALGIGLGVGVALVVEALVAGHHVPDDPGIDSDSDDTATVR